MPPGYYGLRVETPHDLPVEKLVPSTLGIIINDGTDRGQALACSCGGAEVTPWFGERTQTPGEG
jgi:hypothetical protein